MLNGQKYPVCIKCIFLSLIFAVPFVVPLQMINFAPKMLYCVFKNAENGRKRLAIRLGRSPKNGWRVF